MRTKIGALLLAVLSCLGLQVAYSAPASAAIVTHSCTQSGSWHYDYSTFTPPGNGDYEVRWTTFNSSGVKLSQTSFYNAHGLVEGITYKAPVYPAKFNDSRIARVLVTWRVEGGGGYYDGDYDAC